MKTEPEGSLRRLDPDTIGDIWVFTLLFGILGSRLLFVLLEFSTYARQPAEIVKIWSGGMSLHGGLIGGLGYLLWVTRRRKIPLTVIGDIIAPLFTIVYAFGRVGCFLNGCCYGVACSLPWAVRFHDEKVAGALTAPSHPTQLYGTLSSILMFFILTRWERYPRRDGELFWGLCAMYGFYRGLVEGVRAGATSDYLIPSMHLTLTHVISLVMLVVGLFGIYWLRKNRPLVKPAVAH
jgi:phosphatidylglycerol:prolipoprotein diacylglycerol transferase